MQAMNQQSHHKAILLLMVMTSLVVAAPLTAGDDRIHGEFTRTLKVDGKVTLTVRNLDGDITVRTGSDGEVRIHGTISAGTKWDCNRKESERKVERFEANHPLEIHGSNIRVGYGRGEKSPRCIIIRYDLWAPLGTALEIEQKYGNLVVRDVGGPTQIDMGAGTVRVTGAKDEVQAKIRAGTLIVEGNPREDWLLVNSTGSVRVRFPKDAAFHLDAEAHSGSIDSDFPLEHKSGSKKNYLRGDANGGGPRIRIKAKMGGISIWER